MGLEVSAQYFNGMSTSLVLNINFIMCKSCRHKCIASWTDGWSDSWFSLSPSFLLVLLSLFSAIIMAENLPLYACNEATQRYCRGFCITCRRFCLTSKSEKCKGEQNWGREIGLLAFLGAPPPFQGPPHAKKSLGFFVWAKCEKLRRVWLSGWCTDHLVHQQPARLIRGYCWLGLIVPKAFGPQRLQNIYWCGLLQTGYGPAVTLPDCIRSYSSSRSHPGFNFWNGNKCESDCHGQDALKAQVTASFPPCLGSNHIYACLQRLMDSILLS